ncbi:hypothetical protein GCM10023144_27860 [Pigmentiphaga soli]|uniref:Response regulatory domain-containing protein n=1 Tax=Pigmentiphaga soli TaxID=1007095 RepID=A0ABP8H6H1_9BURK
MNNASAAGLGGALTGLKVLLVDDTPEVLGAFAELLELEGALVAAAGSAREALDAAALDRFDLLISDLSMPDMDGHHLLRALRADAHAAALPAIALSGFGADACGEAIRFDRYLAKPVLFETLLQAIHGVRSGAAR